MNEHLSNRALMLHLADLLEALASRLAKQEASRYGISDYQVAKSLTEGMQLLNERQGIEDP